MRFARYTFTIAGVYGVLIMLPYYFLEQHVGTEYPPAITHPEFYYGFVGTVLVWQLCFLLIARDPVRFRPVMIVAIGEKVVFAATVLILFSLQRVPAILLPFAGIDAAFGVLFLISYVILRNRQ